jgi:O-antigen ligase
MSSRTAALVLTILGAGMLFFLAPGQAAAAPGLMAGLIGIAAIWLASGKTRFVLSALTGLLWLVALLLAVFGSAAAVVAAIIGLSGSVLALAKGSQWPGFSSRYARASDLEEDGLISPRQMWESLDRGLDPTRKPEDRD